MQSNGSLGDFSKIKEINQFHEETARGTARGLQREILSRVTPWHFQLENEFDNIYICFFFKCTCSCFKYNCPHFRWLSTKKNKDLCILKFKLQSSHPPVKCLTLASSFSSQRSYSAKVQLAKFNWNQWTKPERYFICIKISKTRMPLSHESYGLYFRNTNPSSWSTGPVGGGGHETWNLCGCLRWPSFFMTNFYRARGAWPLGPLDPFLARDVGK